MRQAPHLMAVLPNPVRQRGTLWLEMPRTADVEVALYDVRGRRLATLWDGALPKGLNQIPWDRSDTGQRLHAGTYWVRAETVEGPGRGHKVLLLP